MASRNKLVRLLQGGRAMLTKGIPESRKSFVRKVVCIIAIHLVATAIISYSMTIFGLTFESEKEFMSAMETYPPSTGFVVYCALGLASTMSFVFLLCCERCRQNFTCCAFVHAVYVVCNAAHAGAYPISLGLKLGFSMMGIAIFALLAGCAVDFRTDFTRPKLLLKMFVLDTVVVFTLMLLSTDSLEAAFVPLAIIAPVILIIQSYYCIVAAQVIAGGRSVMLKETEPIVGALLVSLCVTNTGLIGITLLYIVVCEGGRHLTIKKETGFEDASADDQAESPGTAGSPDSV